MAEAQRRARLGPVPRASSTAQVPFRSSQDIGRAVPSRAGPSSLVQVRIAARSSSSLNASRQSGSSSSSALGRSSTPGYSPAFRHHTTGHVGWSAPARSYAFSSSFAGVMFRDTRLGALEREEERKVREEIRIKEKAARLAALRDKVEREQLALQAAKERRARERLERRRAREELRHHSAIVIQCAFRGYRARARRNELAGERRAMLGDFASVVQLAFRRYLARKRARSDRARIRRTEELAASNIQRCFRGYQGRKQAARIRRQRQRRQATLTIQCYWRGYRGRQLARLHRIERDVREAEKREREKRLREELQRERCRNCGGARAAPEARFCIHCGWRFIDRSQAAAAPEASSEPAAATDTDGATERDSAHVVTAAAERDHASYDNGSSEETSFRVTRERKADRLPAGRAQMRNPKPSAEPRRARARRHPEHRVTPGAAASTEHVPRRSSIYAPTRSSVAKEKRPQTRWRRAASVLAMRERAQQGRPVRNRRAAQAAG